MPHWDDIIHRTESTPGSTGSPTAGGRWRRGSGGAPSDSRSPDRRRGQEQLHVDGDPHVDEGIDDGLHVDGIVEQDLVGVAVEGLGDLEVERIDHEGQEEQDEGQREQQPLQVA
jgi:hypothetical protein